MALEYIFLSDIGVIFSLTDSSIFKHDFKLKQTRFLSGIHREEGDIQWANNKLVLKNLEKVDQSSLSPITHLTSTSLQLWALRYLVLLQNFLQPAGNDLLNSPHS